MSFVGTHVLLETKVKLLALVGQIQKLVTLLCICINLKMASERSHSA